MKATMEIPDELYRRVKAKSALEGRAIREITVELYQHWLAQKPATESTSLPEQWLADWFKLADENTEEAPPGATTRTLREEDRTRLDQLMTEVKALATREQRNLGDIIAELVQTGLESRKEQTTEEDLRRAAAQQWLAEWIKMGEEALCDAPPGPTATEILAADRDRLE
jgi:hypothetical protein